MSIRFDEKTKVFYLETKNTSYIFALLRDRHLVHIHWGKKTADIIGGVEDVLPQCGGSFAWFDRDNIDQINTEELPLEYPTYGSPDLRSPALHISYEGGGVTQLRYASHRIFKGKEKLSGLPATYADGDECDSLEVELIDTLTDLHVFLTYSVFEEKDAITRSVRLENRGGEPMIIERIMSASVDMIGSDFDLINLYGSWARERFVGRTPLFNGLSAIDSKLGSSGHAQNPFIALAGKNTTEDSGDAYGINLVYSGNFYGGADVDKHDFIRLQIGINPFNFKWNLGAGESFTAPEAVLVYSQNGIGGMSRIFHRLYRKNLCRGKFRDECRYALLNNWEATYFDFNEEKLLGIAQKAKEVGVDLFVLDDGWFGKRNDDRSSLGDWYPNLEKLPEGIKGLAEKVEALGLKFGLWFEPEMVCPNSDLYCAHPDWCIHSPGRYQFLTRSQLTLDLSRKEVCDYVFNAVDSMLSDAKISYVKWDMNRYMTEVAQSDLAHKYMLGLYGILERIIKKHPDVLFEGCSAGGGRFDPGMLHYMPQFWTSDNTDAVERIKIQYGTSIAYPVITMGAHVSAVPNHQVGRVTSMKMRGDVALTGQFGFELDLQKLSDEDFAAAKAALEQYKKLQKTVHFGDMYRLKSPFEGNSAAVEFVSEDGREIVLCWYNILAKPTPNFENVKLAALDSEAVYADESGKKYTGSQLMNIGLFFWPGRDFMSSVTVLKKED